MPERWEAVGLSARRITEDDLVFVELMHTDPTSMASIGGVRDHARSVAYLDDATAHWSANGFGMYLLFDGERLAGRAGLKRDGADAELAYSLLPQYWGRGLATVIARHLVQLASARADPQGRIVAYTRIDNCASRRVMEKAGLVYDNEVTRGDHPCVRYTRSL